MIENKFIMQGWECPKCGAVMGAACRCMCELPR